MKHAFRLKTIAQTATKAATMAAGFVLFATSGASAAGLGVSTLGDITVQSGQTANLHKVHGRHCRYIRGLDNFRVKRHNHSKACRDRDYYDDADYDYDDGDDYSDNDIYVPAPPAYVDYGYYYGPYFVWGKQRPRYRGHARGQRLWARDYRPRRVRRARRNARRATREYRRSRRVERRRDRRPRGRHTSRRNTGIKTFERDGYDSLKFLRGNGKIYYRNGRSADQLP